MDSGRSPGRLRIDGTTFRDDQGRSVLLRGVNLGGDCKVPVAPNGHTHLPTDFRDHRTLSFVGRPFPLDEADAHLRRLSAWGFNCLRLLVTWEAVEHAAPGEYDEAFLDYFAAVSRKAGEHGFYLFVDFHQDVWSRMSGGDGAPGWTWEAAGLDFTRFDAADAAHVMQHRYDAGAGGYQPSYPVMSWAGNYRMPANGIIWTLFFAGADFAPTSRVDGRSIQHFLQNHYLGAMRAVAERVADQDHVIGFDTLNEPGTGFLGKRLDEPTSRLPGPAWTPLKALAAAAGLTQRLDVSSIGSAELSEMSVNQQGVPIWLPGREDPFRAAGAWDLAETGEARALLPGYFAERAGKPVDFEQDYALPFFHKVAATIRSVRPDWMLFAEINPFAALMGARFPEGCPERTVNASHWYDLTALVTKSFSAQAMTSILTGEVRQGPAAIEAGYVDELGRIKAVGERLNGGAPTVVGEFGIPYDLNGAEAYRRWASGEHGPEPWSAHIQALGLMYNALDTLLLSSTQWNYTASNSNDPMIGDGWNQEDLSIWSADQVLASEGPLSGGRAVAGFSRPYVRAAQGRLVAQSFDAGTGTFRAELDCDPACGETEVVIPPAHYPAGYRALIDGRELDGQGGGQLLAYRSDRAGLLEIVISRYE